MEINKCRSTSGDQHVEINTWRSTPRTRACCGKGSSTSSLSETQCLLATGRQQREPAPQPAGSSTGTSAAAPVNPALVASALQEKNRSSSRARERASQACRERCATGLQSATVVAEIDRRADGASSQRRSAASTSAVRAARTRRPARPGNALNDACLAQHVSECLTIGMNARRVPQRCAASITPDVSTTVCCRSPACRRVICGKKGQGTAATRTRASARRDRC